MSYLGNIRPYNILKIGGVQAAQVIQSAALINQMRQRGPLSVILSAPNTDTFRTTNVLIEAATALAGGDHERCGELLLSVRDFVLNTVCGALSVSRIFPQIKGDIERLFSNYLDMIHQLVQAPEQQRRLPTEGNDFTMSVSNGIKTRTISRSLLALGENITTIIYSHAAGGIPVMSDSWMIREPGLMERRIQAGHPLIISGAFSSKGNPILSRFGRGYTDAHAGQLSAGEYGSLFVHKEFPVCTGDPRIVPSKPIGVASFETVRASLHPLIAAQFLNPHVFSAGEPGNISVGDFRENRVTSVVREDIPDALPLIQQGPTVSLSDNGGGYNVGGQLFEPNPAGNSTPISVLDHFPNAKQRSKQIETILGRCTTNNITTLGDRTATVMVPKNEARQIVMRLHAAFCED